IGVGDRIGDKRSCANTSGRLHKELESRNASAGTRFVTRIRRCMRSVGTEFKVMQELLRHSTLRSTLDVYTQAITPAKHAAQAAVLSLVFSCEANATSLPSVSGGVAA